MATQDNMCTQIQLQDVFVQTYEIQDDAKLHIQAGERINTNVFITYTGRNAEVTCDIDIASSANVNILFWNRLQGHGDFTYCIDLQQDAQVHVGFGDLQASSSTYTIMSQLQNKGSSLHVSSACLANQKHFVMDITHVAAHTNALMENFAIVKEHGEYFMQATGSIKKGAHGAQSHQSSRVLTLSQTQKSEVIPILLIDENEVKASHATTLGQPDENQLYYLCSRGLTRDAAIGLLTAGYLMPITKILQDEDIQKQLLEEIEEKVIRND